MISAPSVFDSAANLLNLDVYCVPPVPATSGWRQKLYGNLVNAHRLIDFHGAEFPIGFTPREDQCPLPILFPPERQGHHTVSSIPLFEKLLGDRRLRTPKEQHFQR
jgi:hypothetical protein